MIRLDALLGLPLCTLAFALSLPARLLAGGARRPPTEPRTILVTKFLGLGSVLLTTPFLDRLREAWPGARIVFMTFEANAPLVQRLPQVDEVIAVRAGNGLWVLLRSVPGLLWELRARRFDLAFDLEFYSRLSNLVTWGSRARRRVGFFVRQRWRGSLLTDPVYFNATHPYGQAVLALLRPMGIEAEVQHPLAGPEVTRAEEQSAWRRLVSRGVRAEGTLIVVNPNASDLCDERRWPAERFARLVMRFGAEIARADQFVFIGVESDRAVVREVLSHVAPGMLPHCLDLAGRTDLLDLTVLLKRAALVVSNDSGPLHLAASLAVPTVSFFGPETPALYGPVGHNHLVFYSGHWCSPCLSVYNAKIAMCGGENECMRRIDLDHVVDRMARFCREQVGLTPPATGARDLAEWESLP